MPDIESGGGATFADVWSGHHGSDHIDSLPVPGAACCICLVCVARWAGHDFGWELETVPEGLAHGQLPGIVLDAQGQVYAWYQGPWYGETPEQREARLEAMDDHAAEVEADRAHALLDVGDGGGSDGR